MSHWPTKSFFCLGIQIHPDWCKPTVNKQKLWILLVPNLLFIGCLSYASRQSLIQITQTSLYQAFLLSAKLLPIKGNLELIQETCLRIETYWKTTLEFMIYLISHSPLKSSTYLTLLFPQLNSWHPTDKDILI